MSNECWQDVDNYIHYSVSNTGRVKSRARRSLRYLKPGLDKDGYEYVILSNNGVKHRYSVSRLVAKAFVDGYDECYQVNHIDGNKRNNHYTNLEWVTAKDNMRHAHANGLIRSPLNNKKMSKAVRVIETGEIFPSESECARSMGIHREGINACLNGRSKSYRGYHYEFVD